MHVRFEEKQAGGHEKDESLTQREALCRGLPRQSQEFNIPLDVHQAVANLTGNRTEMEKQMVQNVDNITQKILRTINGVTSHNFAQGSSPF